MAAPEQRVAPADVAARVSLVRELAAALGADGALLRTRCNFAWLTLGGANHVVAGSEEGAAPILVDPSGATVIAPVNEADRLVDEELTGTPLDVERVPWHDSAKVDAALEARGLRSVVDDATLEDALAPIRARLNDLEMGRMEWLADASPRRWTTRSHDCDPARRRLKSPAPC